MTDFVSMDLNYRRKQVRDERSVGSGRGSINVMMMMLMMLLMKMQMIPL